VGILVDAAVGDGRFRAVGEFQVLLGAVAEEKDLQVERPLAHVGVKVGQVGVVGDRLVGCAPAQPGTQALSEEVLPEAMLPATRASVWPCCSSKSVG